MKLSLIGLVCLVGCAGAVQDTPCAPLVVLKPGAGFTSEQRHDLDRAAAEWREHGALLYLDPRGEHDVIASQIVPDNVPDNRLAYYSFSGDVVFLMPRITRGFYPIALHEFGHALGVQHQPSGVMRAEIDYELEHLTPSDIEAFRGRHCR